MVGDNGVATAWQSYLGNLSMVKGGGVEKFWTETEVYRCVGGSQQLAQRLAAAVGTPRVHLRQTVSGITAGERGVVVTAGSTKHECDFVVLAIPPLTWNRIAFTPRLHVTALPQMGSNVKFLMKTKDRFWRRGKLSPDMMSDGPVHLTWHATLNQKIAGAGVVAFSGGAAADTCRGWTPAERTERYLAALSPVYPGLRASFERARFMDWPSELGLKPEVDPISGIARKYVQRTIDEGTQPSFVADMVVGAVTSGRFWVFPNPDFVDMAVERFHRIAEGLDPLPAENTPGMPPRSDLMAGTLEAIAKLMEG